MAVNIKLFSLQTSTAWCGLRDVFWGRKEVAADQTLAKSVAWLILIQVKTWLKLWLSSSWIGSGVSSSAHIPVISFVTQETLSRRHDRWCSTADFKGDSSIAAGILSPCSILGVVFSVFFNSKYCCRNTCNSGHYHHLPQCGASWQGYIVFLRTLLCAYSKFCSAARVVPIQTYNWGEITIYLNFKPDENIY